MLKWLVTINLFASAAHFLHNAVFRDSYPGPPWIPGPWFIVAAWCIVAATLVAGLLWHQQGKAALALLAVTGYCASCIFVFGHYLYGRPADFDLLTNLLIFFEGIGGALLFIYFVGWGRHRSIGTAV